MKRLHAPLLVALLALASCDSDPPGASAPSVDDLITAYGDQPPGEGVVHEGERVSTRNLIHVSAIHYVSGTEPFWRMWIDLDGTENPFVISASLEGVGLEDVQAGQEYPLVRYFCCNGGGGGGFLAITEVSMNQVEGVFYADVQDEEFFTNPRRYMGGFNATLDPPE